MRIPRKHIGSTNLLGDQIYLIDVVIAFDSSDLLTKNKASIRRETVQFNTLLSILLTVFLKKKLVEEHMRCEFNSGTIIR